jgi:uncharacterized phiE125 gp8 family phage protein
MYTMSGRKPFRLLQPAWQCLNRPSADPISIAEAKLQCRIALDESSEDLVWNGIIQSAVNQVESDTSRSICWQRWKLILDEWPDTIQIYNCPVISVESVKYYDYSTPTASLITVSPSEYAVSLTEPARVASSFQWYWQPSRPQIGAIEITFTAGYVVPFTSSTTTSYLTFTDYVPVNGNSFRLTNSGGELPLPLIDRRTYYMVNCSGSTCQLSLTSGGSPITLTTNGFGLHYIGEVPQSLMQAIRKKIAVDFADREGSEVSARCEESYLQSLRATKYTVI